MRKRICAFMLSCALLTALCTGCGSGGPSNSQQATPENPMVLTVAHSLTEGHATHIAIKDFADRVYEKTGGRIQLKIFPNALLGADSAALEQLMAGVLSITNVASPAMGTYNESYHTFGLPYLYESKEQYYKVMDSQGVQDFFRSTSDDGFITLTYFTSGARSFYTPDKAIRSPEDLKGMKIRVQDMKSQTDMLRALGGAPIAMAYGEVYTSLQTGIIDGTENNELALTQANHGELCKVFSKDEHAMIPDVLVMSAKVWNNISPEDQALIIEAAHEATENHKVAWDEATEASMKEAEEKMGVEFILDIDKEPFIKATANMREEYAAQYPGVADMLALMEAAK